MKKIINKLCYFSVSALLALPLLSFSPCCIFYHYQPEVPKALRK